MTDKDTFTELKNFIYSCRENIASNERTISIATTENIKFQKQIDALEKAIHCLDQLEIKDLPTGLPGQILVYNRDRDEFEYKYPAPTKESK